VYLKQNVQGRQRTILLIHGSENIGIKDHSHKKEFEVYWKSLGGKV